MAGSPGDGRKTFLRFPVSQEEMLSNARSRLPTPIGVLLFVVLFFAIVSGTAYIQMSNEVHHPNSYENHPMLFELSMKT